jgi:hypothetical protein
LRLGIETQLGTTVAGVDEHGLDVIGPDGSPARIEARTLARWTIAFLGHGRPERTITEQQVFARTRTLETDSA